MKNDPSSQPLASLGLRLNREKLKTFTTQTGLKTGALIGGFPTSCPFTVQTDRK